MPVDNHSTVAKPGSRLRELGLVLPKAPTPLGAYVEASDVGSLLFLSGILPAVNRKLSITGRLGENLSVEHAAVADGASDLSFNSSAPNTVMCGRCVVFKVCRSARLSWWRSSSRSNNTYIVTS
jgi:hypothetical protein